MQNDRIQARWQRFATPGLLALVLATLGCQATNTATTEPTNETSTAAVQTEETTAVETTAETQPAQAAEAAAPVRVGEAAPEFTGVDSLGNPHSLSDFRGQVVVLEWTNHQCPFVGKHYESGNMQKLQAEATGQDVVWLSIISSAPGQQGHVEAEKANELTESRDAAPTAVLLDPDGEIGRMYDARTTPHMFVINEEGVVEYMGAIDSIPSANIDDLANAENYVQTALTSVLAAQPVEPAVTQPYGCSVKYDS